MFQSISWAQYWLAIGIAAIIYYGLLVLRYASAHGWRWLKTDKESAAIRLATFYPESTKAPSPKAASAGAVSPKAAPAGATPAESASAKAAPVKAAALLPPSTSPDNALQQLL